MPYQPDKNHMNKVLDNAIYAYVNGTHIEQYTVSELKTYIDNLTHIHDSLQKRVNKEN